jgi:hypothetical protein
MDDKFYRNRARVLRELATEADPLIKKRLLRLANNYDDMATTKTKCDQAAMKPELYSTVDSCGSN